jgi:hypothetical protein
MQTRCVYLAVGLVVLISDVLELSKQNVLLKQIMKTPIIPRELLCLRRHSQTWPRCEHFRLRLTGNVSLNCVHPVDKM